MKRNVVSAGPAVQKGWADSHPPLPHQCGPSDTHAAITDRALVLTAVTEQNISPAQTCGFSYGEVAIDLLIAAPIIAGDWFPSTAL